MTLQPTNYKTVRILLSSLIIGLCHSALGQSTTALTTKPATKELPEVQTLALKSAEGDVRLQHSIKLEIRHETLESVLKQIGKEAKIEFGYEKEWIGELSTTAFANSMPIYTALRHIAQIHNLSWRKEAPVKGDPPQYILFESDDNKRTMVRLKKRAGARLSQKIARYRHYADMSAQELESLAQDGDSWASFFTDPEAQSAVRLIAALPNSQLTSLQSHQTVAYCYDGLTPEGQKAFADILKFRFKDNALPNFALCTVRYSLQGEGTDANISAFIGYPNGGFMPPLIVDTGGKARLLLDAALPRYADELAPSLRAPVVRLSQSGDISTSRWDDALAYMAKHFQLNVFADAYPGFPEIDERPAAMEIKVEKGERFSNLLDSCGSWGRDWRQTEANGKDILLRLPDWFEYRDNGITQRLLNRIMKNGREAVQANLQDWIEIAALPAKQIPRVESALGIDAGWIEQERPALSFLRTLTTLQISNLADEGIVLSTLSEKSRRELLSIVDEKSDQAMIWREDGALIVILKREGDNSLLLIKAGGSSAQRPETTALVCRFPCHLNNIREANPAKDDKRIR